MSLDISFNQGLNTSEDPSRLKKGELVQATGIYYRDGDSRATKIGGVTTFANTGSGKKIDGVELLQFDSGGSDKIVALSEKVLYGSDIDNLGATGSFSSLKSGLATGTNSLSAAHSNDRWYLALGTENLVVESDGTTRAMGMSAPPAPDFSTSGNEASSTITRAASASGAAYTNAASAYDSDTNTYASLRTNSPAISVVTYSWSGTSDTGSDRFFRLKWALGGSSFTDEVTYEYSYDDVGGSSSTAGFDVSIKVELSEDNGSTYTTVLENKNIRRTKGTSVLSYPVTDALEVDGNLKVRITKTYHSGAAYADLRHYDVTVESGSETTNFSTTTGLWYALTEYDADRGLESPAGIIDTIVTMDTKNNVTLTLPSTATNTTATHWRIYRSTDGGGKQSSLGLIGEIKIDQTSFVDDFRIDKDDQAYPLYPLLRILGQQDSGNSSPIYFSQNNPPPRCTSFRTFEGSIVGFPTDNKRALVYSMAGFPEAFPKINAIESFPFEDHDELVDGISLGNIFLIAAKGLMMRLTALPRAVNSVQDRSRVEQIKGAPGCVGRKALTAYSVAGEPRAAWISPYGIYATNGDRIRELSSDIDWFQFDGVDKSGWELKWDANRLCLVFSTGSTDGYYYLLHMAPEHKKRGEEQPKWTGPHSGSYNSFATGQVDSTHRLYGGHTSNGRVYILDRGGTDASKAYSSTQVPLIVKTGQIYADPSEWSALDAFLYHTDFGGGETCELVWEVGNDHEVGGGGRTTHSVALSGHKGTQLDIAQRCQWAQATITHTGGGQGAIRDLSVSVKKRGERGAKRAS